MSASPSPIDDFTRQHVAPFEPAEMATALERWFASNARDLPWRREPHAGDPYAVLVSEMMLQQTLVKAVIPFFERFMARFPDVATLASAAEDQVLALWAGLGYYSRARHLQNAAKRVMDEHQGRFPRDFEAILALPGVGRYTAGAVASIALGQRHPIVEANVTRVLCRVLCLDTPPVATVTQNQLWQAARALVEVQSVDPRALNPAMMELGALVCTPRAPRCPSCPIAPWCQARARSLTDTIPARARRRAPTSLHDVCALALLRDVIPDGPESDDSLPSASANAAIPRVLLRRRPADAPWWADMWEPPRTTRDATETTGDALERLGREIGVQWRIGARLDRLSHGVTRFRIELEAFEAHVKSATTRPDLAWFSRDQALALALPSPAKRLLERAFERANSNSQQPLQPSLFESTES